MAAFDLDSEIAGRLLRAQLSCLAQGVDALLVTPGPDLAYLTGYHALPLERLTCLVLPAVGQATLVAPELEVAAANASPVGRSAIVVLGWPESGDAYKVVAQLCGPIAKVGLDAHMWAEKVLNLRIAMPSTEQVLATTVLGPLRAAKTDEEIAAITRAGAAIDAAHNRVGEFLRAGRTEAEVGADIAGAIVESGHAKVDFVIVASGPNGASPHHELSDRVIGVGEPVVVDIGGTMPDGYCSDSTRMYCIGEPPAQWAQAYEVLFAAQEAGVRAALVGASGREVDAACRAVMIEGGLGEAFIHRTGHGIGLETHEEPYIADSNGVALAAGNAFSIEPGFYFPGLFGARIEDIVIATADGPVRVNNTSRRLVVVQP